ncbi:MAG TPA: hypothetical protein PKD12_08215 [Nitrospira sp.]|nr:hypothetical protein [Nitrospira sp.]
MHSEDREPDFSGWATKAGIKCTDGRTIMPDAFKHQDKMTVPLVWQHCHDEPTNVLGHAVLENRPEGVYAYGYFNGTPSAEHAKTLVQHNDISSLSILANQLVEKAQNVIHGVIREVSLVMAGANPGALIDNLSVQHADGDTVELEDEAIIHTGLELEHESIEGEEEEDEGLEHTSVQEVYDGMTEEQQGVVNYMVGAALATKSAAHSAGGGPKRKEGRRMSRNVFEQDQADKKDTPEKKTLSHDDMRGIAADAVRRGSLREAVEDYALKHGINDIDILFPDAKNVTGTPEFDKRRTEWVSNVLNATKHSPFSRIKSIVADITHDEARARGYIKGNLKKEEFFGLVKRVTTPSTVYKKQKLDRDDIIDITDFDIVVWLKGEMRLMLDEEIATACLIGDGRAVDDEDKIKDPAGATEGAGIRSIAADDDLYAATITVNANGVYTEALVDELTRSMQFYKGSGSPTLYTTNAVVSKLLTVRNATTGQRLWRTKSDLAAEIGVAAIVEVETMERRPDIIGIIVNLQDYTFGTDRGGETTFFDDFDIDYNQYKYLYETRLSGALTKIRSAMVIKEATGASPTLVVPASPSFNSSTGAITITNQTGVVYKRSDTNAVVNAAGSPYTIAAGDDLTIYAEPASSSYYFENNIEDEWTFERPAA